jgi:predicted metalloendopeptidase
MLGFLVKNQQKLNARKILALEIAMSKPRFDRVERRDRRKSYNNDSG